MSIAGVRQAEVVRTRRVRSDGSSVALVTIGSSKVLVAGTRPVATGTVIATSYPVAGVCDAGWVTCKTSVATVAGGAGVSGSTRANS